MLLAGRPYEPPGAPQLPHAGPQVNNTVYVSSPQALHIFPSFMRAQQTQSQISLALRVAGTFNFQGHNLSEFIVNAVVPHLDDDDVDTRKAAAVTTSSLLSRDPILDQLSCHSLEAVTTMLDGLLSVGVVDNGV
jgi:FKBP12-rapamycin complex-associated protein